MADPVKIILDTDIAPDVDDVGAVALLHQLANLGEAEIVGTIVSSTNPDAALCLDSLNTYFGRPDIPVGIAKVGGERGRAINTPSKYAGVIAKEFPHDLREVPEAGETYRKILANQPDGSVVIVTIGFLTNLATLLETEPDGHSDLNGVDLVKKKVKHWVCMGSGFPDGREYNIFMDAHASEVVLKGWPTPVTFSPFGIGVAIMTGARLVETPEGNPVRRAYALYLGGEGKIRQSWDQTAVLYAVRGLEGGLSDLWDVQSGKVCRAMPNGTNKWEEDEDSSHSYLVQKMPPKEVARIIEDLMMDSVKTTK